MSGNLFNQKFQSSDNQHFFVTTTWLPDGQPIGVVQLVHGMREYIGRYHDFAKYLNSHGYIVCGHDHIGHGKSALLYGSYGFFGEDKGAGTLVSDSIIVTNHLFHEYPDLPIILLGHSMGSYIARIQATRVSHLISGLIVTGTGGDLPISPLLRAAVGAISAISGPYKNNYLVDKIFAAFCERGLLKNEPADAWISRDRKVVREFTASPYTHFTFTNQGYSDLLDLQIACNSPIWYEHFDRNLPFLLLSGTRDPIGSFGLDAPKISKRLKLAGVKHVQYRLYPGARHELLNEVNRAEVYANILSWIDAHLTLND